MKQEYSSKEEIVAKAKDIILEQGIDNLSMRKLASECYLALGTLYHYFASKEDLLVAIMEDYWKDHFKIFFSISSTNDFKEMFSKFYDASHLAFSNFESLFIKRKVDGGKTLMIRGKMREAQFKELISNVLIQSILDDKKIDKAIFNNVFPLEEFVLTLVDMVVLSLVNHDDKKDFLLHLINLILYKEVA